MILGDGTIVSVSMRRSFHLAVVVRISASVSRCRLPCTSVHAYHHHRRGAASRSQMARTQQVIKAVPTSASGPASSKMTFQASRQRLLWARKMRFSSLAQNFLPLRGADMVAPCGAGNFLKWGARAKKRLKIVAEQNRRSSSRWFRKSRCGGPTLQGGSTCAACVVHVYGVSGVVRGSLN